MATRMADCHPTRPHLAKGLCEYCYKKSRGELPYQRRFDQNGKRATCHPARKHYARGMCRACYQERFFEENPDKKKTYYRKLRQRWHGYMLKNKFSMTPEQYAELLDKQNGVCAICGKVENDNKRLSVDHDHKSGNVRGLLCQKCNTIIGMALDNPDILVAAIRYLEKE